MKDPDLILGGEVRSVNFTSVDEQSSQGPVSGGCFVLSFVHFICYSCV